MTADFESGLFCGFSGPDGCGKGLLLNVLGLLEAADEGELRVSGLEAVRRGIGDLAKFRNETFGFVFSTPALLPAFSIAENVAMPFFRISGADPGTAGERTMEVLEFCGIADAANHLAGRVPPEVAAAAALARALVHRPKILVMVSPKLPGALVPAARRAAKELGLLVLWSGPADLLKRHADRLLEFQDGRLVEDRRLAHPGG